MFSAAWDFLKDGSNQALFGWIGSGIAVVAGGAWTVLKFAFGKSRVSKQPSVTANNGSVAAGRDVTGNTINIKTKSASRP
jgi:hypothetical protein